VSGQTFAVVIPARYASTRLPGKPLADIGGKPMIVRVAEQARASGATEVVVATDDIRVHDVVADHGCDVIMTRVDHVSGSDRVMEVAEIRSWADDQVIVNVQGDEPLIPPLVIDQVAQLLTRNERAQVATLCERIVEKEAIFDPNAVKVVADASGRALYFSRAPIPWDRDNFPNATPDGAWFRHIGIYGYRARALTRFCALIPGRLELLESLEQLRFLENGVDILVAEACATVPSGVDTPADLERARAAVAAAR
jgi:3-deoxy-manno-octulosonate cytidylyltransferase (CMP-KDO synthetase)